MSRLAIAATLALALALALAGCNDRDTLELERHKSLYASAERDGRWSAALAALKQAVALAPDDAGLRWQLGRLYLDLGVPDAAESHLRRAMDLGISASSVLPLVAKALVQMGKYDEVVALARPESLSADAHALLAAEDALAHLLSGRPQEASESVAVAVAAAGGKLERVILVKARLQIAQDQRELAVATVRGALASFPNDPELWALLADLERDAGNAAAADAAYSRAIELSKGGLALHVLRGRLRLDTGNLPGAEEDAAAVERLGPGTFQAYLLRGRLALQQGKGDAAVAALQSAMRLDRFSFEALFYAGLAAQANGRPGEAQDLLQRAVADRPDFLPARYAFALLLLERGQLAEAEAMIRPVVEALPDREAALRVLAAVLVAQGRSDEAVAVLNRAAAAPEAAAQTRFQLGVALMASGQSDRGDRVFDHLADVQPSYRILYDFILGYYFAKGDLAAARNWLRRFQKERPDRPESLVWQARLELAEGRRQEARDTLARAIAIDPKGTAARYALARIALADNDGKAAREQLEAVVSGKSQHLPALLSLSALDRSAGRLKQARRWLEMAIDAFPSEPAPLIELARMQIAAGAPRDALTLLRGRSDERFHNDPGFLRVLGEAERLSGERQKATLTFRELIRLEPDSISAHYAYAQSLLAVDDRANADGALARVLELDPKHDRARLDYVRLLYVEGQYLQAEEVLGPMRRVDSPEVKLLAGLLTEKLRSPAQALPLLEEAHAAAPSQQSLLVLARVAANGGHRERAIAIERAWLADFPQAVEVRISLAHDLMELGRVGEAIAQYREVLQRSPDNLVALNNLAWLLRDTEPQLAVAYALRAFELAPDSDSAADTLAEVYERIGRSPDALRTTELGLMKVPHSEPLKLRKAQLLLAAGDAVDAVKLLVELARSDSGSDAQVEAKRLLDELLSSDAHQAPAGEPTGQRAPPGIAPEPGESRAGPANERE